MSKLISTRFSNEKLDFDSLIEEIQPTRIKKAVNYEQISQKEVVSDPRFLTDEKIQLQSIIAKQYSTNQFLKGIQD